MIHTCTYIYASFHFLMKWGYALSAKKHIYMCFRHFLDMIRTDMTNMNTCRIRCRIQMVYNSLNIWYIISYIQIRNLTLDRMFRFGYVMDIKCSYWYMNYSFSIWNWQFYDLSWLVIYRRYTYLYIIILFISSKTRGSKSKLRRDTSLRISSIPKSRHNFKLLERTYCKHLSNKKLPLPTVNRDCHKHTQMHIYTDTFEKLG